MTEKQRRKRMAAFRVIALIIAIIMIIGVILQAFIY